MGLHLHSARSPEMDGRLFLGKRRLGTDQHIASEG